MRLRTALWVGAMLLALAPPLRAQVTDTVVFTPEGSTTVFWDASSTASTDPLDALTGYTVVAAQVLQVAEGTNLSIKTWDVGNVLTLTLPGGQLPSTPFYLSVRAKTASGRVSQHSNSLLFQPAGIPSAPPNLRRGSSSPQAHSEKPANGEGVTSIARRGSPGPIPTGAP